MPRPALLIEVSPSELRAAVVRRARPGPSRSAPIWLPNWKETWPACLAALAPQLRALVEQLGAGSLPAAIFYSGPQAASGVYSCPVAAGVKAARSAAALALAEGAEFSPEFSPTSFSVLATDRKSKGVVEARQAHTLAVTDPEASVRAVLDLGATAGCRVSGVFPSDGLALAAAVRRALAAPPGAPPTIVLRIGAWGCTLAASAGGRLKFVRQISLGTASLVSALAAGLRIPGDPVPVDRHRAGAMLEAAGIPDRADWFDEGLGIKAESALPIMQPILQRCVVEIRQSLRFGLSESERAAATLVCTGPGSALPNLPALIAQQCALTLSTPEPPDTAGPLAGGAIEDFARGVLGPIELLIPGELAAGQRVVLLQRGMWIGVAAASLLGAVDGVSSWLDLASVRRESERLRSAGKDSSRMVEIAGELADQEAGVRASRARLSGLMTPRARWDALLSVLAEQTPAPIRLSSLDMRFEGRAPVCTIRGLATAGTPAEATGMIKSFMAGLSGCPLVERCQLGNARRSRDGDGGSQEFEITLTLVGLPAALDFAMANSPDHP